MARATLEPAGDTYLFRRTKMRETEDKATGSGCGRKAGQSRNAARTRDRILKNAERLFTVHPYELVTLRQIATMSEINVALIGRYYGSKKELFCAVIDSIFAQSPPLEPEDKLGDLSRRIVRFFEDGSGDDSRFSMLNILMLSSQSPEALPIIQKRMTDFLGDMADTEGVDAVPATGVLTACILGGMLLRRLIPENYPLSVSSADMGRALKLLQNALEHRSGSAGR